METHTRDNSPVSVTIATLCRIIHKINHIAHVHTLFHIIECNATKIKKREIKKLKYLF